MSLNGTLKCREVASIFLPLLGVLVYCHSSVSQSPHSFCFIYLNYDSVNDLFYFNNDLFSE